MELSSRTLGILRNFGDINQNLLVDDPKELITVSETKTILAKATIDESLDQRFGLYQVNEFLSCLSVVEKPSLKFGKDRVTISDEAGISSIQYVYSNEENLTVPSVRSIPMPDPEVKFNLTVRDLAKLRKATGVFDYTNVIVSKINEVVTLSAVELSDDDVNVSKLVNGSAHRYDIAVGGDWNCGDDSVFVLDINNLKLIEGNYEVELSSKMISHFVNTESSIEYWIALQKQTVVEGV
tara:strand:+ start:1689 stop:2402 length:714 start_codon:yes stop_codon:yes gene_type:complete